MYESEATEPVGVYEELEILSAEQTGKNKVQVTFSAPATADDKLTVKKGATEVTFTDAFDDATYLTKTLTFTNDLATGTYTVTLTPEDEDVDPSSVEFETKSATKAATLEVVGDYLVMKDTDYKEGYFFIKGYNGIGDENDGKGEEVPLSGLQVNVAPSDDGGVSYDSTTGKVTVKYTNPGFAVVKNVSVFAQYTGADGNILTTQKTLEVSTIGYPSAIEFGDVKKDGTAAPREDGLITIDELGTNKYYVELNTVQDQYGNDLSANDLNDLMDHDLLTVIPVDTSPVFFGTNTVAFSEKDGKVVVFLTSGTGLPGTGALMITGAGGTFSKDITISDNPYIEKLNVEIPDLYEGERSDKFSFSAVDQYGDTVDLYDFVPEDGGAGKLIFDDLNHLTTNQTYIQAESTGKWIVVKDTVKKTFEVYYEPAGTANSMATFTTISAGMNSSVRTVTIQGEGKAAQVVAQGSAIELKLNGDDSNLNSIVSFKDANGKTMVRTDCYDNYPIFKDVTGGVITSSALKDKDLTEFYWTVTENKFNETDTAANNATAIGIVDTDGVIKTNSVNAGATVSGDFGANNGDGKVSVKVFYDGKAVDTIQIAYSDDAPVPTKTEVKLKTTTRMGENWDAATSLTRFETSDDDQATATFADGKLTITKVNNFEDTLTAVIKDQYGQVMTSSTLELNGEAMDGTTYTDGDIANFVMTNGSQKIDLELEVGDAGLATTAAATKTTMTVNSEVALNAAIAEQIDEITIAKDITLSAALTISDGVKVIVPAGIVLNENNKTLTVEDGSTLVINGELATTGAVSLTDGSTITVNGNWAHSIGAITGEGNLSSDGVTFTDVINGTGHVNFKQADVEGATLKVSGSTLVLDTVTFTGAVALGGHVKVVGALTTGAATGSVLLDKLKLELTETADITDTTTLSVAPESTVTLVSAAGDTTEVENQSSSEPLSIEDEAGDVLTDNAIANTVKLWVALAGLTEADEDTAEALEAATEATEALEVEEELPTAFIEALADAVTGDKLDTVEAITVYVGGLIAIYDEAEAIKDLLPGVTKQTATTVEEDDTYKTFEITLPELEGSEFKSATVTSGSASAGSIDLETGLVTLETAVPDSETGATYTITITTELGNTIKIEAKVTRAEAADPDPEP